MLQHLVAEKRPMLAVVILAVIDTCTKAVGCLRHERKARSSWLLPTLP